MAAPKTTDAGLLELGDLLMRGASPDELAAALGFTPTTGREWKRLGRICACGRATRFADGRCRVCRRSRCVDCGAKISRGSIRCASCFSGVREGGYECRGCNEVKPEEQFSPRGGNRRKIRPVRSLCRSCEYDATLSRMRGAPEKRAARNAVYRALVAGVLVKGPCARADASCKGRIEAHHEDYAKRLEVEWLCQSHHSRAVDA